MVTVGTLSSQAAAETTFPTAEADDWQALLDGLPKNWDRWGPDDELGAINFLGSEEMFEGMNAAMKCGKTGIERFTLQVPVTGIIDRDGNNTDENGTDTSGGDPVSASRTPAVRDNIDLETPADIGDGYNSADDKFITDFFLQGTTHLDSLGHAWVGHEIYNGFDAETTVTPKSFTGDYNNDGDEETIDTVGLAKADISNAANAGVVGRGVLLDVARYVNGDDRPLPLGYCIGQDDLQATARSQEVTINKHDIVLIRTGALERYYNPEYEWNVTNEPGLCFEEELVEWVYEMELPVLGGDNIAVEKLAQTLESPHDDEKKTFTVPLHPTFLQRLGVSLHEIVWLEGLAASCATDDIYDFLFAAAPIDVERATGAPMNSIAIKATSDNGDK